jgi:hypothetical protein
MSYLDALDEVRSAYRDDLEVALVEARRRRESAQAELVAAERAVHMLEGILTAARGSSDHGTEANPPEAAATRSGGYMTLHEAMHKVIRESPDRRMRAAEIIAEIERQGLYRMRDGRVPESQQIHARANHYPHLFDKEGSHFVAR